MEKRKISGYIALIMLFCLVLSGCSMSKANEFKADRSGIFVKRDLSVKNAILSELTGADYSKETLESFVKDEISRYNEVKGAQSVVLESVSLNDSIAKLIFSYNSPASLVDFAKESQDDSMQIDSLDVMSMDAALATGKFVSLPREIASDSKSVVISVDGKAYLSTEGKILYAYNEEGKELEHTEYDINLDGGKNYIIFK